MLDFGKRKRTTGQKRLNVPGIFWGVLLLFVFFSILRPAKFLSLVNILLIARNSSVLILASIGMTMVILVSQIDLSVGSVMSFSGVVAATMIRGGANMVLAFLAAMVVGLMVGLTNGLLIAKFKFDYWIVTFATMGICAGLALVVANGETVQVAGGNFAWVGNGKIGGIYFMLYLTVFLIVAMQLILSKSKFGYNIYSIGGSEQSASLSGIAVVKNRIAVYMCSGLFASFAGIMLASMGSSASPIAGADYSFDSIAAVIIGGTSFDGGKGGLIGTVLGALLLRILTSGLNLLGIPSTWQKAIIGVSIVTIIIADVLGEKLQKKNDARRRYADE